MSSPAGPERREDGPGSYRMPFGAHKDKRLRDLPIGYALWLLTVELRSPLREHLRDLLQELHHAAGGEGVEALFTTPEKR